MNDPSIITCPCGRPATHRVVGLDAYFCADHAVAEHPDMVVRWAPLDRDPFAEYEAADQAEQQATPEE
jgi:hypothetical protein